MASQELQGVLTMLKAQPVDGNGGTVEEQRAGIDALGTMFPLPVDVTLEKVSAAGVSAEWLTPPGAGDAVVLYLHGGGYVIGSIASHRELAARIARSSGARALIIDYRLAPEHPFPAAVDDAVAAYRWLLTEGIDPAKIAISGDSAGGGLTMATLVALRDMGSPLPACAAPMSPWVDLEGLGESMTTKNAEDPMVHKPGLDQMASQYLNGADPHNPLAAPLYADLHGLPPLLIQVGTAETLLDDSRRLAANARAAGVDVELEEYEELFHVFQAFSMLPEALDATEHIGAFVRKHTAAPVPA